MMTVSSTSTGHMNRQLTFNSKTFRNLKHISCTALLFGSIW